LNNAPSLAIAQKFGKVSIKFNAPPPVHVSGFVEKGGRYTRKYAKYSLLVSVTK